MINRKTFAAAAEADTEAPTIGAALALLEEAIKILEHIEKN